MQDGNPLVKLWHLLQRRIRDLVPELRDAIADPHLCLNDAELLKEPVAGVALESLHPLHKLSELEIGLDVVYILQLQIALRRDHHVPLTQEILPSLGQVIDRPANGGVIVREDCPGIKNGQLPPEDAQDVLHLGFDEGPDPSLRLHGDQQFLRQNLRTKGLSLLGK